MPRSRFQPPDQLPEATAFSSDLSVVGSLTIVELMKTQRWLYEDLKSACDLSVPNSVRRREPGEWALALIAFIVFVALVPEAENTRTAPYRRGARN